MNVANLQLEGLVMAIAAMNHLLVQKGLVSMQEIDAALREAETRESRSNEIPPANREAIVFPIRLLQLANQCQPEADLPSFSALTRMVGQMK
ncbi:hypothetical protein [Mesorhizobium sp. SP-1A]|uniref:hypothetical protein n=1 Tax=Mesorhizobium sp. SP-1A TaxID=3077840 RepID=UPI0028F6EB37|nr:hypothetical protein [Mesorhizobium sp. SP-1A]